jgi:hypothetical protein
MRSETEMTYEYKNESGGWPIERNPMTNTPKEATDEGLEWKQWRDNFLQHLDSWSSITAYDELEKMKDIIEQGAVPRAYSNGYTKGHAAGYAAGQREEREKCVQTIEAAFNTYLAGFSIDRPPEPAHIRLYLLKFLVNNISNPQSHE